APVAGLPVEGAEVAVRVADVRVVDVAVDNEGDAGGVGPAAAQLVRDAADRDEIVRGEQRQGVGVADPFSVQRFRDHLGNRWPLQQTVAWHQTGASAETKRSSGTRSSSPTSCAS